MFCIVIGVRETKGLKSIAQSEFLSMLYSFGQYKFAMKAILCNAECFYIVENDM